jgi:hypothetical protein
MGEIFHALEVLNRSMKLGLNGKDLLRAEMGFKSALAMQGNPAAARLAADPARLAEGYELKATLRRRTAKLSLNELSKLAAQAVKQPRTRVSAATFKQIDKAIVNASAPAATPNATAVKKSAAKAPAPKKTRASP